MLGQLQEDLLVLLSFNDQQASIIRNSVDLSLYGGPYRIIATRIYDYLDRYKKPPGDHLADILSDKLDSSNEREASLFEEILRSIHSAQKGINTEYVMNRLDVFIRRQSLRIISGDLIKALQKDTEESIGQAEALLTSSAKSALTVFDPGTRLSDPKRALAFLDATESALPTGVPELDKRGFGPTRQELWLFIGNTKAGKTWGLIHLAKMALMQRVKVCHITLEMSEKRCAQRYLQALFAIAKRDEVLRATKFQRDQLGRISGFDSVGLTPKLSLDDPQIRQKLEKLVGKWPRRLLNNVIIKQFPTGSLTIGQLRAYLDNLETTQQFVPDLLIVDYPDLMKIDADNVRIGVDVIYKDLRGLAVSRNLALAVVSQSHRAAAKSKQVGAENVAEAYSKIAHADTIITYTQTKAEHLLGLARLHVAGGRNDVDKLTVVISQQYGTGAFVIDSALMTGGYWNHVPQGADDE